MEFLEISLRNSLITSAIVREAKRLSQPKFHMLFPTFLLTCLRENPRCTMENYVCTDILLFKNQPLRLDHKPLDDKK